MHILYLQRVDCRNPLSPRKPNQARLGVVLGWEVLVASTSGQHVLRDAGRGNMICGHPMKKFQKVFYLTNLNVVWNESKIPLSNLPHNVRLGNLVRNFNPLLLTCWLSTLVATRLSFWHGYPSQFLPPTASWWPKKPKPFDHRWLISEQ